MDSCQSRPITMARRILLTTDTSKRHFSGVQVRMRYLEQALARRGHRVMTLTSDDFASYYVPFFPEQKLAIPSGRRIRGILDQFKPHYVHLETEGPLGRALSHHCRKRKMRFTTAFTSRYDLYISQRLKLPQRLVSFFGNIYLRHFHKRAVKVFVRTASVESQLRQIGITNTARVAYGIDTNVFFYRPDYKPRTTTYIYVGRIADNKNLEAFLDLELDGKKVLIGEGPSRPSLSRQYPDAEFLGFLDQNAIAERLNNADVFVFPSRTETLGNVILEAGACGVPVAAYPEPGPIDVIQNGVNGFCHADLREAISRCWTIDRQTCAEWAKQFDFDSVVDSFLENLVPV